MKTWRVTVETRNFIGWLDDRKKFDVLAENHESAVEEALKIFNQNPAKFETTSHVTEVELITDLQN